MPKKVHDCLSYEVLHRTLFASFVIFVPATFTLAFSVDKNCYCRLGCPVRCLVVKSVDQYGNEIPFLDTSGITITIFDGDDVLAHVDDVEVELSSDSLAMNVKVCHMNIHYHNTNHNLVIFDVSMLIIFDAVLCMKDFLFKTSKLDILRPKYEAKLKLSSFDNKLSGIWPCKG